MAKRILIVDDEPNIVTSLEYLMKREGYDVQIAVDGEAGLEAPPARRRTWSCSTSCCRR